MAAAVGVVAAIKSVAGYARNVASDCRETFQKLNNVVQPMTKVANGKASSSTYRVHICPEYQTTIRRAMCAGSFETATGRARGARS